MGVARGYTGAGNWQRGKGEGAEGRVISWAASAVGEGAGPRGAGEGACTAEVHLPGQGQSLRR